MLVRDVADVRIGPAPPEGATLRNGETVSGMVIMLKGENGKRLIERVKQRIADLRLPPGVKIVPFYDQSFVIDGTIHTVEKNLFEGFVLVTLVLLLFLGNLRAAIITASIIPFSMLISFLGMRLFGISANLMSLGAIDFGMIVDGAVVMMENFDSSTGKGAWPGVAAGIGAARRLRSRSAHDLRRRHHHRGLSSDPFSSGARRPDVPAHGNHCLRCLVRLSPSRSDHDSHAGLVCFSPGGASRVGGRRGASLARALEWRLCRGIEVVHRTSRRYCHGGSRDPGRRAGIPLLHRHGVHAAAR